MILLPVEVPGRRVHRDDEFDVRRKRAFEKPVVWFMPDHTRLAQRIADCEALNNFSDEFPMVAEDVCVLFENGRRDPRLEETGVCKLIDQRRRVVLGRERRELQNAGVTLPPTTAVPYMTPAYAKAASETSTLVFSRR